MDKLHSTYLIIFFCSPILTFNNTQTLKSISVTFRHGDRTPTPIPSGFYPTDPYKNDPMEPMGYGGITNEGKRREYQIGVKLRERYNTFLDNIYRTKDISVVSTNFERTKMSLLLVLAGLYPPTGKQVWMNGLNWQPIPINAVPSGLEGLVNSHACPNLLMEIKNVTASNEYKNDLSVFNELMRNLTTLTGRETTDSNTMFKLFHTLAAESAMNLTLPEWTKPYFPDGLLKDAIFFHYRTLSYTTTMKKLNGGVQIRKILNDILPKEKRSNKKVHLYSAHETTIAGLLYALNLWQNVVPEYGSAVIVELHQLDGKNFLKVISYFIMEATDQMHLKLRSFYNFCSPVHFSIPKDFNRKLPITLVTNLRLGCLSQFVYYSGIPPTFETRIIPGCSEYCPIEEFLNILKDVIPDDVLETCYGPPDHSLLIPKSENPIELIYGKLREWYNV